jgi:nicotinamidase-related amidase
MKADCCGHYPIQAEPLQRTRAGLVVIDLQERLLPAIFESERVLGNAVRLIRGASILKVPVFATEQYSKGLGATVPAVAAVLGRSAPFEKTTFSACEAAGFRDALKERQIAQVILCGIEAHVCVTLTCLDLLRAGFWVYVVADAVSSRTAENKVAGLERMRGAGAVVGSTEMALFELVGRADASEFKEVLALVKQAMPLVVGGLTDPA